MSTNQYAAALRKQLNALQLDLAHCNTPDETRQVKQAIRKAEFALSDL